MEGPPVPRPMRCELGGCLGDLSGRGRHHYPEAATRLQEAGDVADVAIVGPEVVICVEAHDRVEEVRGKGQLMGLRADGKYPVGDAGILDPAPVFPRLDPEVGGPDLHPELAGEEDRAQRAAATEIKDTGAGLEWQDLG